MRNTWIWDWQSHPHCGLLRASETCLLIKWTWFHYLNRLFGRGGRASILPPNGLSNKTTSLFLCVSLEMCFLLSQMDFESPQTSSSTSKHVSIVFKSILTVFFSCISSFDKCCIKNRKYSLKKSSYIRILLCFVKSVPVFSFDVSLSKTIRSDFSALNTLWLHVLLPFLQVVMAWKSFNKLLAINGNRVILDYFPHKH